jgi:MFS family permease
VNHYYRESGLCHAAQPGLLARDLGEIKKSCPEAYVLASILTGVSQLVALITAPVYGYLSDKSRRHKLPLHFAALVGVAGYVSFPLLPSPRFRGPDGNFGVFVVMGLLGLSQIGAIVCSLAVLNDGILNNSDRKMESGAVQGVLQEPSNAPLHCSTVSSSWPALDSAFGPTHRGRGNWIDTPLLD